MGGGRHVAKRSSDQPGSLPRSQSSGTRDIVWVVGIVAPFAPRGLSIREKFVLSSPSWQMDTGDLCRIPQAAVRHGRARQSSGTGPCGDCTRVLWVEGPWGQDSGKIRFIEKPEVQD